MVTNDDRRRVAAALRHYAHSDLDGGLLPSLKDAAEVAGGTWRTLFLRLADLIEPNGIDVMSMDEIAEFATVPEKISPLLEKSDRVIDRCDRDALLALADEMDMDAGCNAYVDDYSVNDYARRIREACGVTADE